VRTPEQIIEVYAQGWDAMEWLARHAKNDTCRECANYHRRVEQGGKPRDLVRLRCNLAQVQHRKYMAVKHMRQELDDAMECFLMDGRSLCYGPVEWVLAKRRNPGRRAGHRSQLGELIEYQIGCKRHAEKAEARAVINGDVAKVTVERLKDLSPEEARLMA
jgi:hypothetical protein